MRRAGSRGACALLSPGLTPPVCPLPTSQEKAAQRKQHAMTRHRDPCTISQHQSRIIGWRLLLPGQGNRQGRHPPRQPGEPGNAARGPCDRHRVSAKRGENHVEQQCCGCGPLPSLALDRASGGHHHHLAVEGPACACGCGSAGLPCPCRCRAGGRSGQGEDCICMQGAAVLPAALHHYCTVRNVRGEATERVRAGAATFALHVHVVGSRRGRAVLPARALPDCRSLSLSLPVPMRPCPPPRPRESSRERWRARRSLAFCR